MKKLLNRQQVEKEISEKWEHISDKPEDDADRHELVEALLNEQKQKYQQLDTQDKILSKAWIVCNRACPENPLSVMETMEKMLFDTAAV